jgi:hypothetical protein
MDKATDLKTFMRVFFGVLAPCFRPPTDDVANAKALATAYFAELSRFDAGALADAAQKILTTRKDPFFPTLAECIEVCRVVKAAKQDCHVEPPEGWEFRRGTM